MTASPATTAPDRCRCRCGADLPRLDLAGDGSVYRPRLCLACAEHELQVEADADAARYRAGLLERAGGGRLRSLSLDTYPTDEEGLRVLGEARSWLDTTAGRRPNLILFGPVGSGKTGLAWGLVRELCERGVPARMLNFRDHLAATRNAFRTGDPPDLAARRVAVLCLDDLGAERPTDWARDELATLVEERYQRELPTIVTSNYAPSEIAARLGHDDRVIGERIVSRLVDGAWQIRFRSEDRRVP